MLINKLEEIIEEILKNQKENYMSLDDIYKIIQTKYNILLNNNEFNIKIFIDTCYKICEKKNIHKIELNTTFLIYSNLTKIELDKNINYIDLSIKPIKIFNMDTINKYINREYNYHDYLKHEDIEKFSELYRIEPIDFNNKNNQNKSIWDIILEKKNINILNKLIILRDEKYKNDINNLELKIDELSNKNNILLNKLKYQIEINNNINKKIYMYNLLFISQLTLFSVYMYFLI